MEKKELDTEIKNVLKKLCKVYGYKTRGGVLYKQKDEYFITAIVCASGKEHNQVKVRAELKPFILDDIFWDVFQMNSNSDQPIGLRANGAFVVKGLEIFNVSKEVTNLEEVECIVDDLLKQSNKVEEELIRELSTDYRKFVNYCKKIDKVGLLDIPLVEMLLNINDKCYQTAKDIAMLEVENHRYGHMENKGKDIYEYVIEYCSKKISQQ